jgi:hypothetical protein
MGGGLEKKREEKTVYKESESINVSLRLITPDWQNPYRSLSAPLPEFHEHDIRSIAPVHGNRMLAFGSSYFFICYSLFTFDV